MAYNYEYPYTDPNRYNADWLLNKVKELDAKVGNVMAGAIKEYLQQYYDEFMLHAMVEGTTLYINSNIILSDSPTHIYSTADETMEV